MSKENHITKGPLLLLIGTRKGAFVLRGDSRRKTWKLSNPIFLGHIIHHVVLDPRDRKTMLMAARTGHLGPTVFRSTNRGEIWTEASQPPAFPKAENEDERKRVVDHVFWLTPGHKSEPGVWYAGTSPQGLFRTEDHGKTWYGVPGFNEHPMYWKWVGGGQDGTPDGPKLHSIFIDPRDRRHMYFGMSQGGCFESTNQGADWKPLNKGCEANFLPDPHPEYGHDPHCIRFHPQEPDILYQQNHCGIYRMARGEGKWIRVGRNMPKKVGDIGFPLVLHPRDPKTLWVFPMDGTSVWPRTSPDGKPAVFQSRNSGKTWKRLATGLPKKQAWLTVKRQAMTGDSHKPLGLYFGTTNGEIWGSTNEGKKWKCLVQHLPHIYSVEAAELK